MCVCVNGQCVWVCASVCVWVWAVCLCVCVAHINRPHSRWSLTIWRAHEVRAQYAQLSMNYERVCIVHTKQPSSDRQTVSATSIDLCEYVSTIHSIIYVYTHGKACTRPPTKRALSSSLCLSIVHRQHFYFYLDVITSQSARFCLRLHVYVGGIVL